MKLSKKIDVEIDFENDSCSKDCRFRTVKSMYSGCKDTIFGGQFFCILFDRFCFENIRCEPCTQNFKQGLSK